MPSVRQAVRMPLVEIVVPDAADGRGLTRVGALLDDAVALRPAQLVVDLAACRHLDAAGIAMLVDAHRRLWQAGGRLTLRGVSPRLRRILALARVDRVLSTVTAHPADHGRDPAGQAAPDPTP